MKFAHVFWNPGEHRLRTWVRMPIFAISVIILFNLISIPLFLLTPSRMAFHSIFYSIGMLTATLACIVLASKLLDKRPLINFGLRINSQWWQDLLFGISLGLALMAFIFCFELAFGWVRITASFKYFSLSSALSDNRLFLPSLMESAILYLSVGIYEELIMRGYFLKNLAEWLNGNWMKPKNAVMLAVLISSAGFGWLHYFNPNATVFGAINIALAGIFLAYGFLLTGNLGISIGLHIAWNFTQGVIFGFPVSGATSPASILVISQSGPSWITGGAFGPEGGIISSAAMLIGVALIFFYCRQYRNNTKIMEDIAHYPPAI